MQSINLKALQRIILIFVLIILSGVAGYMIIEHWNIEDSLFMVLITLSTIGYGQVHPLSDLGKAFTMLYITFGVGFGLYAFTFLATVIIEGSLHQIFWRNRMIKNIKALNNHFIVCGVGRVGSYATGMLANEKHEFVVIDIDQEKVDKIARKNNWLYLSGDASSEDVLKEAGIHKAKGILVTTNSDPLNLYIVLTAKMLNPTLVIIARANLPESYEKLKQAGATRVISPHVAGGKLMVSALLKPNVANFLESTFSPDDDVSIEEFTIREESSLASRTIKEADFHHSIGITIIAVIKAESKKIIVNPTSETMLHSGDNLIVIGTNAQINALSAF